MLLKLIISNLQIHSKTVQRKNIRKISDLLSRHVPQKVNESRGTYPIFAKREMVYIILFKILY